MFGVLVADSFGVALWVRWCFVAIVTCDFLVFRACLCAGFSWLVFGVVMTWICWFCGSLGWLSFLGAGFWCLRVRVWFWCIV